MLGTEMREGQNKQVPKGEIMEGQCSPLSSRSFGTVVVVVDDVAVAAAVWVLLLYPGSCKQKQVQAKCECASQGRDKVKNYFTRKE